MKIKRKLTVAQKRKKREDKRERQRKYQWIFINGKQVRIKRPELIERMDVEDFIRANADPVWLQQNERWDILSERYDSDEQSTESEESLPDPD